VTRDTCKLRSNTKGQHRDGSMKKPGLRSPGWAITGSFCRGHPSTVRTATALWTSLAPREPTAVVTLPS
jgi:hypothetical protein